MRTVAPPSLGERLSEGALAAAGKAGAVLARDPKATLGISGFALFAAIVTVNALTAQTGRHPQPLFQTRAPAETAALDVATVAASDPLVRAIQEGLSRTGHYRSTVDGRSGPATQAAIRAFQGEWGLAPDGIAGSELLVVVENAASVATTGSVETPSAPASLEERMGVEAVSEPAAAPPVPTPSDLPEAEIVRRIQAGLTNAHVAELVADGIAGPATRRAIEAFQALEGMEVTGEPEAAVLDRLVDLGVVN